MARTRLILNRYRPLSEAGAGGFGTVQVAWDTRIQRKVAIKCIELDELDAARLAAPSADAPFDAQATVSLGGTDPDATAVLEGRDGFIPPSALAHVPGLDEARTAALLTDSTIVAVYDFEVQGRTAYLIMEYVEGLTLTQLLDEHGDALTLDIVAAVFSDVAHALEVAHENRVLHLDIKPDNILIDGKGQVKVTDFGLAKLADASGFGAAGGGTIGYMPLEQMRGEDLDARCDEWALASVAYEMLTGGNPFLAETLPAAERAVEDAELVLPSLCWDGLDAQVDDVLFYALDPDRDERYETVSDFAEEMEKFLGSAKRGRRQLAALVNDAQPEAEDEPAVAPEPRERIPLAQRVGPLARTVAGRAMAAVGSAAVAALGAANVPSVAGVDNPLFWGVVAVAAALSAAVPAVGALASYLALAVALVAQGAPAVGLALAAAAAAWWWFAGRGGAAAANVAFAVPLAGAVGANALAPLAAGGVLRPVRALATTAFSLAVGLVLASFGSGNLLGWDGLSFWHFAGRDVQAALGGLLLLPETWCMAAGWLVAAAAFALFRLRRTRAFALAGLAVSTAVLIAAACATAWIASGGATAAPSAQAFAALLACAAVAGVGLVLEADEADGGLPDEASARR
ncbi:MAG TPA: serine/threonine protein kinase [Candidatus Aphodovivens avistercoris]|nr:serine/threonine protein kinase [Candidatus Aphodovivens avistercoris]